MKIVKSRTHAASPVNDERCQVLLSKTSWNVDRFEVVRNNVQDYYG
jgi:hypothetical protein